MVDLALSKILMERWASSEQGEITSTVALLKPKAVLDVGCGSGDYLRHLEKLVPLELAAGIDLSRRVFNSSSSNITFVVASVNYLPFAEDTFDAVFAKDLLHHVSNASNALYEMLRVSRDYLILVEANRGNLLLDMHVNFGHPHFTFPRLKVILAKLVCSGCNVEYKQLYVYPFPLRIRTWNPLGLCWNIGITFVLLFAATSRVTRLVLKKILRHLGPSYNLALIKKHIASKLLPKKKEEIDIRR